MDSAGCPGRDSADDDVDRVALRLVQDDVKNVYKDVLCTLTQADKYRLAWLGDRDGEAFFR